VLAIDVLGLHRPLRGERAQARQHAPEERERRGEEEHLHGWKDAFARRN
jgi:hypothetical protein